MDITVKDRAELIEDGLDVSVKEIMKGITVRDHDVVDGFEVTTSIDGYDCTSDFFLDSYSNLKLEIVDD